MSENAMTQIHIIQPHVNVVDPPDWECILRKLNRSARVCYLSEPKDQPDEKLVKNIRVSGHTSVLEHVAVTFDIITDRGVLAEFTRHRHASYSVESTRYCNYQGGMTFIDMIEFVNDEDKTNHDVWEEACRVSAGYYDKLMKSGCKPQTARSVLNNSLKCKMRVTMNLRSMMNFFDLRCDAAAHPHIKQIAIPMLMYMCEKLPVVFEDIPYDESFFHDFMKDDWWSYITETSDM